MNEDFKTNQVPPCPGGFVYIVAAGNTYYSIARRFGITVSALTAANPGVDPDRLAIGQLICVPAPRPVMCPTGIIYTIKAGDTFFSIARANRIDVYAVMKANPNVDPNKLRIGQQICVPGVEVPPCPSGKSYTIAAGDTYFSIARRNNITVDALLAANPGVNPDNLQVGQVICLP